MHECIIYAPESKVLYIFTSCCQRDLFAIPDWCLCDIWSIFESRVLRALTGKGTDELHTADWGGQEVKDRLAQNLRAIGFSRYLSALQVHGWTRMNGIVDTGDGIAAAVCLGVEGISKKKKSHMTCCYDETRRYFAAPFSHSTYREE